MIEIEVHVAKLVQLFNNIDAAPFASRDLDPRAERFIVDSAKDLPRDASFGLAVHVGRTPGDTTFVGEAVHAHFRQQSASATRLAARVCSAAAGSASRSASFSSPLPSPRASWPRAGSTPAACSMWRPLELFLYDWWPIRAEARPFDRLASIRCAWSGSDHYRREFQVVHQLAQDQERRGESASPRTLCKLAFHVQPDQQCRRIGDLLLHLSMRVQHVRKLHAFRLAFGAGSFSKRFQRRGDAPMLAKHGRHIGREPVGQFQDVRHGRIEFAQGQWNQEAERRQGILVLLDEVRVQDFCYRLGGLASATARSSQPGETGMELVVFSLHRLRNREVHVILLRGCGAPSPPIAAKIHSCGGAT